MRRGKWSFGEVDYEMDRGRASLDAEEVVARKLGKGCAIAKEEDFHGCTSLLLDKIRSRTVNSITPFLANLLRHIEINILATRITPTLIYAIRESVKVFDYTQGSHLKIPEG